MSPDFFANNSIDIDFFGGMTCYVAREKTKAWEND